MLRLQKEVFGELLGPLVGRHQVAQGEHPQRQRHEAVDAHHGGVGVVGRQCRPDLVVGHDGQVDQEAEDTGPQEVPEADSHEEHDGPAMREGTGLLAVAVGAQLHEGPGLHRQEGQGDHFGG